MKKTIFLGLDGLAFFIIPETGEVGVRLHYPNDLTGLVPNLELGIRLNPEEARTVARVLERKADAAETSLSRHP